MKLVIEIDDIDYKNIIYNGAVTCTDTHLHGRLYHAIKLGTPFDKVIEDIRAEIDAQIDLHDTPFEIDDGMDSSFCDGLNKAKEIIDKYISREEKE